MAGTMIYGMDAEQWADRHAMAIYQLWKWNALRFPKHADTSFSSLMKSVELEWEVQTGAIDFVYAAMKRGDVARGRYARLDGVCSDARGRCYYNALDWIVRNPDEAEDRGVSLAIGYVVEPSKKEKLDQLQDADPEDTTPQLTATTKHAFLVTGDGRVYDPTLGEALRKEAYTYERVPAKEVERFSHALGDDNHDASDVVDYFDRRLDDYKGMARMKDRVSKIYMERKSEDLMTERELRGIIRRVLMDEAKKKRVVRKGKRKKKLDCRDGYKAKGGKCVKMSSKERRNRSRAAKRSGRRKSGGTKRKAARRAKRSKKRR